MKKPHAGFWLATLGLGVCWLLALLTRDRLNGLPLWTLALWIGFGCWWYWLLDVVRAAPWPLAVLGAAVGPFAYAVSWKLGVLLPGVPPEFMLLLLAVGWSIYLPAVSWLQWKRRNS